MNNCPLLSVLLLCVRAAEDCELVVVLFQTISARIVIIFPSSQLCSSLLISRAVNLDLWSSSDDDSLARAHSEERAVSGACVCVCVCVCVCAYMSKLIVV